MMPTPAELLLMVILFAAVYVALYGLIDRGE
jgi:hypothetical protein